MINSTAQDPAELDQITTLPNGVRVATEALPGPFSGIGVYVDAGSRYENESLRGVSHIVDRLAFKVSSNTRWSWSWILGLTVPYPVHNDANCRPDAGVPRSPRWQHTMRFLSRVYYVPSREF